MDDDTSRLLLSAARYPAIDVPLAVQQIEARRTAAHKWPSLVAAEDFEFPPRLNREQASSEATARYKAALVGRTGRVADLTGGMGVDTLALAAVCEHVDYVERDAGLCALAQRNFRALGVANIDCHCADSMEWLAQQKPLDWVYVDPARRSTSGRKVAAFEDCTPDLLAHLHLLRTHAHRLMVKASPMIDTTLATAQLQRVGAVHIVAVKGECKEVLLLCGDGEAEPVIHCVDIGSRCTSDFTFRRSEEQAAEWTCCTEVGAYLYDPHAALMKGGPFRLVGRHYGVQPLAPATHLYTSPALVEDFPGRIFVVERQLPLNRKAVRQALPEGKAHVVVRNFPAEAAALQRQLGLSEGGDRFVVATTVGTRRAGFLCRAVL